jgi:hypothetical protein
MLKNFAVFLVFFIAALFSGTFYLEAQTPAKPQTLSGISFEELSNYSEAFNDKDCSKKNEQLFSSFNNLMKEVDDLGIKRVVRVVFQNNTNPSVYKCVVGKLSKRADVMGMFLDSFSMHKYHFHKKFKRKPTECAKYDDKEHNFNKRIVCYAETLNPSVKIWEIGNEVNGEWVDEGCDSKSENDLTCQNEQEKAVPWKTKSKIAFALEEIQRRNNETRIHKETALTFVYQPGCYEWSDNQLLRWIDKFKTIEPKQSDILSQIDYFLVSYYEDPTCDDQGVNTAGSTAYFLDKNGSAIPATDSRERLFSTNSSAPPGTEAARNYYWNSFFNFLQRTYGSSNTKFGFGEVGYNSNAKTGSEYLELGKCGAKSPDPSVANDRNYCYCKDQTIRCESKTSLLQKYYSLKITSPQYVGGYFWWTAQQDIEKDDGHIFRDALKQNLAEFIK